MDDEPTPIRSRQTRIRERQEIVVRVNKQMKMQKWWKISKKPSPNVQQCLTDLFDSCCNIIEWRWIRSKKVLRIIRSLFMNDDISTRTEWLDKVHGETWENEDWIPRIRVCIEFIRGAYNKRRVPREVGKPPKNERQQRFRTVEDFMKSNQDDLELLKGEWDIWKRSIQ